MRLAWLTNVWRKQWKVRPGATPAALHARRSPPSKAETENGRSGGLDPEKHVVIWACTPSVDRQDRAQNIDDPGGDRHPHPFAAPLRRLQPLGIDIVRHNVEVPIIKV